MNTWNRGPGREREGSQERKSLLPLIKLRLHIDKCIIKKNDGKFSLKIPFIKAKIKLCKVRKRLDQKV